MENIQLSFLHRLSTVHKHNVMTHKTEFSSGGDFGFTVGRKGLPSAPPKLITNSEKTVISTPVQLQLNKNKASFLVLAPHSFTAESRKCTCRSTGIVLY